MVDPNRPFRTPRLNTSIPANKIIEDAMIDAHECEFKRLWYNRDFQLEPHMELALFGNETILRVKAKGFKQRIVFELSPKRESDSTSACSVMGDDFVSNIALSDDPSHWAEPEALEAVAKLLGGFSIAFDPKFRKRNANGPSYLDILGNKAHKGTPIVEALYYSDDPFVMICPERWISSARGLGPTAEVPALGIFFDLVGLRNWISEQPNLQFPAEVLFYFVYNIFEEGSVIEPYVSGPKPTWIHYYQDFDDVGYTVPSASAFLEWLVHFGAVLGIVKSLNCPQDVKKYISIIISTMHERNMFKDAATRDISEVLLGLDATIQKVTSKLRK